MALKQLVNAITDKARELWDGKTARLSSYDPRLDSFRNELTKKLTYAKLAAYLTNGINGELGETLELFEDMEALDGRYRGLIEVRRNGYLELEYEIVSAAEIQEDLADKKLAGEAAAATREIFDEMQGSDALLQHLATAMPCNLAVAEVVWDMAKPVAVFPVRSKRLRMELMESEDIRVITAENRKGIVAGAPKFIVHIPNCRAGSPVTWSLSRAVAYLWLAKKLAISDWGTFAEIFGMPFRIGKYPKDSTPEEKETLKALLRDMGPNGWGMFSQAVELEFVESSGRGISPHQALVEFCNREFAVSILGGNLTSDTTGGTGTYAAANVQDRVRDDLRDGDMKREAATLREQLFKPICQLTYPGRDCPTPFFRRVKPETIDRKQEAELYGLLQKAGMQIPRDWAYDRMTIPQPKNGEEVLQPPDAFADSLAELPFGAEGTKPRSDEATKGKGASRDEGTQGQGDEEDDD